MNNKRETAFERRRAFLDRSAVALGREWASSWRQELREIGRPAVGGWPGTIPEARARVDRYLVAELARQGMARATDQERQLAAKAMYATAKHEWISPGRPPP